MIVGDGTDDTPLEDKMMGMEWGMNEEENRG